MAIKSGVPIVPIACSSAHRIMEKRSLEIHPGEILVEFLAPIDASKYTFEERETLNEVVHDAMAAGLPADQRPGDCPGAVEWRSLASMTWSQRLTFRYFCAR